MERRKGTLETMEGRIGYTAEDGQRIRITDYSGMDTEVWVPEEIEGIPVKIISKKTFLSRKQLRKVVLPETVEEIGDWAFAYCTNLESVWLPKKEMKLGSRIFMECPNVRKVFAYGPETERGEIGGKLPSGKGEEGQREQRRGRKETRERPRGVFVLEWVKGLLLDRGRQTNT